MREQSWAEPPRTHRVPRRNSSWVRRYGSIDNILIINLSFRSATHFVQVERDIDDPLYVAVFLLVVNAAHGNYVIPGLVPPFFRRHYKWVDRQHA